MRLGSLMLCSCACQAAVLTNPFDPAHADSCCVLVAGHQRFDASLLPESELMVTNEDNDGPGAHLFTFFGTPVGNALAEVPWKGLYKFWLASV